MSRVRASHPVITSLLAALLSALPASGLMPAPWLAVYAACAVLVLLTLWQPPSLLNRPGLRSGIALLAALLLEMVWEAAIDAPGFAAWGSISAAKAFTWLAVGLALLADGRHLWRRRFWRQPAGRDVLIVLAVAVGVRVLTAVSWGFHAQTDGAGYVLLAQPFVNLNMTSNLQYAFYQWLLAFILRSTQYLGPLADTGTLTIFLTLSLIVPLTSYDILRRVRGHRAALLGGLIAAAALPQIAWAHHSWSEGTSLWLMMLGLWGVTLALDPAFTAPRWRPLALAGGTLGMLALIRPPVVLLAPLYGLVILLSPALRRHWLRYGLALGLPLILIAGGWTLFIHYPTTGALTPAPYAGWNFLLSAMSKGLPVLAENGPASDTLIRDGAVHTPLDDAPMAIEPFYRMMAAPDAAASPAEAAWYTAQPPDPAADLTQLRDFPVAEWMVYLGVEQADALMMNAFRETVAGHEAQYGAGVLLDLYRLYDPGWGALFPTWTPDIATITWGASGLPGWQRATLHTLTLSLDDAWLWRPGVRLLGIGMRLWQIPAALVLAVILLAPALRGPAPDWRRWMPVLWAAIILWSNLVWVSMTLAEPRRHALVDPLWVLCLAWLLAGLGDALRGWWGRRA